MLFLRNENLLTKLKADMGETYFFNRYYGNGWGFYQKIMQKTQMKSDHWLFEKTPTYYKTLKAGCSAWKFEKIQDIEIIEFYELSLITDYIETKDRINTIDLK